MKIVFLGTGTSQGIPVVGCKCATCLSSDSKDKRLRCSLYIEWNGKKILIDTGPDLRQQALQNGIDEIDAIFYTHEHYDHTAGLDEIRPFYFKKLAPIDIYLQHSVLVALQARFGYIFMEPHYPGVPRVSEHIIHPFEAIDLGSGVKVEAIPVKHGNLDILGYKIGQFAYLTDVGALSQHAIEHLKGVSVLAISALQLQSHHSHISLDEALNLIAEINPDQAFLIHMSHHLGPVALWSKHLPTGVQPSYDGQTIEAYKEHNQK